MSINNVDLPVQAIADLYTTSLVITERTVTAIPAKAIIVSDSASTTAWKFLGNNQKQVLLIINTTEAVHLPDNELSFLTGILTACKLSMADVAIVNLHNHPDAGYKDLTNYFNSKNVILFGTDPVNFGLPISFPQYQIQSFTGTAYLYAPCLKDLESDKAEKMKLWACLKKLFGV